MTELHLLRTTFDRGAVCISTADNAFSALSGDGIIFTVFDRESNRCFDGDPVARGDVPYVLADLLGISGGPVHYTITDTIHDNSPIAAVG